MLKIEDPLERSFYAQQTIIENWSTTQLIRQKKASLFLRLAASKDKEGILKLAQQGQVIEKPTDLIREPYILEFLKIPEPYHLSETELEKRIIENLQHFLLELGKGFALYYFATFVSKYQLYLPNKEELQALISKQFNRTDF